MVARDVGMLDSAAKFKANLVFALPAEGKAIAREQSSLMHQPMFIMSHAVDPAVGYAFSGPVLLVQNRWSFALKVLLTK